MTTSKPAKDIRLDNLTAIRLATEAYAHPHHKGWGELPMLEQNYGMVVAGTLAVGVVITAGICAVRFLNLPIHPAVIIGAGGLAGGVLGAAAPAIRRHNEFIENILGATVKDGERALANNKVRTLQEAVGLSELRWETVQVIRSTFPILDHKLDGGVFSVDESTDDELTAPYVIQYWNDLPVGKIKEDIEIAKAQLGKILNLGYDAGLDPECRVAAATMTYMRRLHRQADIGKFVNIKFPARQELKPETGSIETNRALPA